MALDKENIKVLNYNRSFVSVTCKNRSVGIEGSVDGVEPNFDFFTMGEIEYINAHTPSVFRDGLLEFEEEYRDEIYTALRIPDWQTRCIFERDIDDMFINPSFEKTKKIVEIKNIQTIERIRGHMKYLMLSGQGVGTNLQQVVERRFEEITNGVIRTSIEVEQEGSKQDQMADLQRQMAQMQAMLEASMVTAPVASDAVEPQFKEEPAPVEKPVEKPVAPAKKAGRPAKKTTTVAK